MTTEAMTTLAAPTAPHAGGAFARTMRQLGVDSAYTLLGLPLSVASFSLLVTGVSLGASLLITIVGIPVLVGTLYLARFFGAVERRRFAPVLRVTRTIPVYKRAPDGAGFWRRMGTPLSDG